MSTQTITRNVETLAGLFSFKGEQLSKAPKGVTAEESIKLGVSLYLQGTESQARGCYVVADKLRTIADAKEVEAFRASLKAEFTGAAVAKAVAALGNGASKEAVKAATDAATDEGAKKYDNFGQTLRAARFMLENPKAVADGVSIFTVQQLNAYLEEPTAKEGEKVDPLKLELHNTARKLLAAPGTSLTQAKKAVKEVKEKAEAAKKPVDARTEDQKKEDAKTSRIRTLCSKVVTCLGEWDAIVTDGMSPDELRRVSINPADASKGSLADAVKALAALAGLKVG